MKFARVLILSTILSTGLIAGVYPVVPATAAPVAESAAQKLRVIDADAIKGFFSQRNNAPYWHGMMGLTREADYLLHLIDESWTHGLNPEKYHYKEIQELNARSDKESQARMEILLTDAFIRYVRDMSGMRVRASSLGLDPADWLQPYSVKQSIAFLNEIPDIKGFLKGLPPQSQTYVSLQKELIRTMSEPQEAYESVLPISLGGVTLRPGQRNKGVPSLRVRLNVKPLSNDQYLYDDRLAAAMMKFQHSTGQKADGVIGPATLKLLIRSNKQKLNQIIANLERLRWVDDKHPDRFVMVNIPAATAWAVDHGNVEFQMPVIVGKKIRQTQSFIAEIQGVRFNPDWTVPPTIKREDILPKLVENPDYISDKGMELIHVSAQGSQTIDPKSVDWENITSKELSSLEMVQIPGSHNPLGKIRILMPNKYNIYLHDTNQPQYFDRAGRAQSSGCIRMKEPEKMAAFVMGHEDGWSDQKMKEVLASGRTRDIRIAKPIPVYLLYYTAWTDEHGRTIFGNDIYDLDNELVEKLSAIDGIPVPVHTEHALAGSGRSKLASVD